MSPETQAQILHSVRQTLLGTELTTRQVLAALGISAASCYRWQQPPDQTGAQERSGQLTAPRPTPEEEAAVRAYALQHPQLGYKRLCWQMLDEGVAALRPYQVYDILGKLNLIARRPPHPEPAPKRPEPPQRPDAVWHIDLMYLYLSGRWYYLVDIVDGYSRFLVHWSLNTTMLAQTVTLTVQEAMERLAPVPPWTKVRPPHIVHDHGSQFVSAEWHSLIQSTGLADIKTRVAHPQSNGVVERLHRTHREEAALEADTSYQQALDRFAGWSDYYNLRRPHSALAYLCPADYYRGDPEARLAERRRRLNTARAARAAYWSEADAGLAQA